MYDFVVRNGTCRQMTTLSSVGSYIIFPAREVSWEAKIVRDFDEEDNEYGVKAKGNSAIFRGESLQVPGLLGSGIVQLMDSCFWLYSVL